jgi:hypothetical protein
MKKNKRNMKWIAAALTIVLTLSSCSESFLDVPPTTGLSEDKLVDIPAMRALILGAYDQARNFTTQSTLYAAAMVRDVEVRNRDEYVQFFDHEISTTMTSWMFNQGYQVMGSINRVAVSNLQEMEGTDDEKNAILGDMHFLRALMYFDLNNYFALPSTGYSVPLVKTPVGVNDRVACSPTQDVINAIEEDIELARTYFQNAPGVANYYAATALAARIYFFHKKYDKAYERANEVISSGNYIIEGNVSAPFIPGSASREIIFRFIYNAADGSGRSPTRVIAEAYQANASKGFYILNDFGIAAQLMQADTNDARYTAFYNEQPPVTYIDGKYSTDRMDYIFIRLAEMHLTRAEANIMVNGNVSQQDVDDINILRNRANPSTVLTSIPSMEDALNILFDDRIKELAFEMGDHYLNRKRLEKGIINTPLEGSGFKPYSEYSELLVFPFPDNEVKIHGLTRNP